jgi:CO/xanthine dehydrogenase FAD-binding subunit
MNQFEYASPATLQEALALLGSKWGEADVLAGGTDLLSLLKDGIHKPKRLVNIKGIKELVYIKEQKGGLRIGAATTITDLVESDLVSRKYPVLTQAAKQEFLKELRQRYAGIAELNQAGEPSSGPGRTS